MGSLPLEKIKGHRTLHPDVFGTAPSMSRGTLAAEIISRRYVVLMNIA
jgi:hypothetical protein